MTETTAETETAPKTGTSDSTATVQQRIVFSDAEKWSIQMDARRAVCSRPVRPRLF